MRLAGKTIMVTGGASGIGRATCLLFARHGAERIYIVDRDADRLAGATYEVEELGAKAVALDADLADGGACRRVVAEAHADAGSLDVVVSNAGLGGPARFLDLSPEEWDLVVNVDFSAGFHLGQAAARVMVEQGTGGVILYTASGAAYGGLPMYAHYAAAKAGLVNLVKTMAIELGPYGIRVNSVSPGPTDTPLAEFQVGAEAMGMMRKALPVPLGRFARPEEIANGFVFLASDEASYVTGIDLPIDSATTQYASGLGVPGSAAVGDV